MKTFYKFATIAIISIFVSVSFETVAQQFALVQTHNTDRTKRNSNYLEKSRIALEKEDLEVFWKHIKQARLKCPCLYKTLFLKGVAHVKAEHLKSAETLFEMALESAENKGENLDTILFSIAQVYALEGKYPEAMEYINRTTGNIGGLAHYKRGLINLKSGKPEVAIGQFLEHVRQQMQKPVAERIMIQESKFSMALCHTKLGNYTVAEQLLREALSLGEDLEIRLAIIDLLFESNRQEEAIAELKKAVKKNRKDVDTRNYLTNILLNEIKLSDAVLNNMFAKHKDEAHSSLTLGNLSLRKGDTETALDYYEEAQKDASLSDLANNGIASSYFYNGNLNDAEDIWALVLEIDPNNSIALEGMGILNFLKGSYFLSKLYLESATQVDETYSLSYDGLLSLGYINILLSSYDKAIQLFTTGIEKSSKNEWAFAGLGYCKYEQFLYPEAIKLFETASKKSPTNGVFRGYKGVAQFWMSYLGGGRIGTKKYNQALNNLEYAFDSGVSNAFIYNALAMCYSELNQFEDAQRIMENVRSIAPDNYEFWMNSGNIASQMAGEFEKKGKSVEMEISLKEMMDFYNKARELGAPDKEYHANIGYGYLQAGKYAEAKRMYNLLPENSSIRHNNLGVVYMMEGNRESASKEFEKAYKLEEGSPMLKMIYDLNSKRSYNSFSRNKLFTSIYHFFLPMEAAMPEINNETNLPVLKVLPEMPEDEFQALLYNDKTLCEKVKKTTTTVVKEPKKKHFTTCI